MSALRDFVLSLVLITVIAVSANTAVSDTANCVPVTFKQLREKALELDGQTICINGFLARERIYRSGDYYLLFEDQATYQNWEKIWSELSRDWGDWHKLAGRRIAPFDLDENVERQRAFFDRRYVRMQGKIHVDCALRRSANEICVGNFSDAPKLYESALVNILSNQATLRFPDRGYEEYQIAEMSWKDYEVIRNGTMKVLNWVAREKNDIDSLCSFFTRDEKNCRLSFEERDNTSSLLNWFLYQNERALGEILKVNRQPKITILKEIPPERKGFQEAFGCVCKDKVCDQTFLSKTDPDIDNQVFADPYYCIPFWSEEGKPWRAGLAY